MANAKYDKAYQGWVMTYTDRTKFRKDGKYLNRTKKKKDTTYPTLPARQKKLKEAEMLAMAQALEDGCVAGKITTADPNKSVVAADYLEQMETITAKSNAERAKKDRRKILQEFIDWLRGHKLYKKFHLEQITRAVAKEYLSTLIASGLAAGTITKRRKALAVIWGIIIEDLEELGSKIELGNPFSGGKMLRRISKTDEEREAEGKVFRVEKKAFSMPQVREIIARHNYERPMLAYIWRLGFLTGWRIGDIKNLRWEQINYANRTLTLTSGKTKIKTILYLTDGLLTMFDEVKAISTDTSGNAKIFRYKGMTNIDKHNRLVLDEMGLDETAKSGIKEKHVYTFHSLRGTMKTALKVKDYNESRLDYLVGHRGKGIDPRHYDKFSDNPEGATRDILEFLESVLDAEDSDN